VLSPELASVFLTAPYFETKPPIHNLEDFTNLFVWNEPKTQIEYSILKLLEIEGYDYSDKMIEYWFQHQLQGQALAPHCDYNHTIRSNSFEGGGGWLHSFPKELVMSPITIGCYLQIGNTTGGELCISDMDWFDLAKPLFLDDNDMQKIRSAHYETFMPRDGDIVYFEGSKYFHWINPVIEGERKSMMINFWPLDLGILEE
jgi:hypothetical protein